MGSVPPPFMTLAEASTRSDRAVNIMGVVTDFMPPTATRGGSDLMCTFSVADQTMGRIGQSGEEGLKVRFFKKQLHEFPPIRGTGDVVILRRVKIKLWRGVTIAMASHMTLWSVIPASSIPESPPSSPSQVIHTRGNQAPALSTPETLYAIVLYSLNDKSLYTSPATESSSTHMPSAQSVAISGARDKFSLIKDVAFDTFYDLVGQVVKTFPSNDRLEMYITDYTRNSLLWNYVWGGEANGREGNGNIENKSWPGPYGQQTLTVTLWPPNSYFVQENVKPDDFVHIRNVRIKFSKDSKLEGALHSDRRYNGERIDVSILPDNEDDERVKSILQRKGEYWNKAKAQAPKFVEEVRGLKRKDDAGEKTESKAQAKKRRKQELQQAQRSRVEEANKVSNHQEASNIEDAAPTKPPEQEFLNKNVHCSHHLKPCRSLSAISSFTNHTNTTPAATTYTLPFQNIKSRATVRITDFHPPNIADFAVRVPDNDDSNSDSDPDTSKSLPSDTEKSTNHGSPKWEWRFQLTLEDATIAPPKGAERSVIKAYVVAQDAEHLLKLDASDLKKSSQALAELREKLFLLWGDLEERKAREEVDGRGGGGEADLGSKGGEGGGLPFQCCLKEYGVRVRRGRDGKGEGDVDGDMDMERSDGEGEGEGRRWERRWRMFGCTIV